jgi:hypothetical protein
MLPLKSICRTRTHQKMLCDNRGWWIFGTVLGGSLNFWKNGRFRFIKHFRIKEPSASVLWKQFRNQRIFSFGFFKNLNELMVFMKESTKNRWFFGRFFNPFFEKLRTVVIYLCQNQLFENFENWQVSEYIDKMITSSILPSFKEPMNTGLDPCWSVLTFQENPKPSSKIYMYIYIIEKKRPFVGLSVCWKLSADQWKNQDEVKQRFLASSPPNLRMQ